jgi:chemotaxis protein histidine kinase CheA
MDKDLPLYDITLEDFEQGMYKISLVDKPAIEENFIYFSKQSIEMFANDEKREVVGPIMIPNKEILRQSAENGYYYVRFTENTIREIMYNYSKKGLFNEFGIQHENDTTDVVMLEIWMKESDNDKSKDYGFDLPNGTVFVKAKIESDELFNAIKDGEINGFSIEIAANITPTNKEEMTEFSFAKELGKLEAQFEAMTNKFQERIEVLESENEILLSSLTSFEEKFAGVEDLKTAIEMIQKHIESMGEMAQEEDEEEMAQDSKEEEEMKEDEKYEATEEVVEETVEEEFTATEEATEEVAKVEENFEAEEEVNEQEVEEQFTAQQTEEVVVEVEDKTIKFERITSDKVNLINKHFPSLY